jgi:hypothetical protein
MPEKFTQLNNNIAVSHAKPENKSNNKIAQEQTNQIITQQLNQQKQKSANFKVF